MKGFRTAPTPNKAKVNTLETEIQNMKMSVRMSQMMIQQLLENNKVMTSDLGNALSQLEIMQYTSTALQKYLSVDTKALGEIVNVQRLKDFEESALKADERDGLVVADAADVDSIVVITSTAQDSEGNDKGIFRSRIKLSECGHPDLIAKMTGKTKGEKVQISLNGFDHVVELLSAKKVPVAVIAPEVAH